MADNSFSTEALVLIGAHWGFFPKSKLSFNRPHAIHPKAKKGLDELVAKGFLTATPRNNIPGCPMDYEPTEKMKTDKPFVDFDFIKENGFPYTVEDRAE